MLSLVLILACGTPPPQAPPVRLPPQAPQAAAKADPLATICRVETAYKGGTGTVIAPRRKDGKWDVLTAYHVAGVVGSRLEVRLSTGSTARGVVAATDPVADVAWLVMEHDGDLPAAELATSVPKAGAPIRHCGTAQRRGRWVTGKVDGPRPDGQLKVGAPATSGDSGGAMFDSEGRVVSIIWCGDSAHTWGAHCVRAAASRPGKAPARTAPPPPITYRPAPPPVIHRPAPAVTYAPPPVRYYPAPAAYAPPPATFRAAAPPVRVGPAHCPT